MLVPLRLSPPATVLTTLLSGLKLSLVRMMPVTQRPKILRRIIVVDRIALLMIHLIRIGAAQSHTPVIILNRPLAPMLVTIQYQGANPRPIRIEPTFTLTTPNHTNLTKKTGLAGAEQESKPKGKQPSRKSSQNSQPKCFRWESNPHVTRQRILSAPRLPFRHQSKRKQAIPTPHSPKPWGLSVIYPNRHKEIQWQKWLFTASHGARMLRESNPRTVPGRHLSEVVQ